MGAVIAICNPKGGTGKTTTAVTLAEQLSLDGARVAVIDLDGQQTLARWFRDRAAADKATPFAIHPYPPTEPIEGMLPLVRDITAETDFLLLDLEGIRSVAMTRAMSRAHLVLIPIAARYLDTEGANDAVLAVIDEQEVVNRHVPYRIVVNRAAPGSVPSRVQRDNLDMVRENEHPRIRAMLRDGPPFDDIFSRRSLLTEQADPVNGFFKLGRYAPQQIERALDDAAAVTAEVLDVLAEQATETTKERRYV